MTKNTTHILELLLHSAKGFYDVGFNCAYNLKKDNDITGFQKIASGAVNMSFAAELFLKGVHLIIGKKAIKGHELFELYEELPLEIQTKIDKRFKYHLENNHEAKLLPAHKLVVSRAISKKESQNHQSKNNLKEFLKIHNLTFQNWRYIHEIKNDGYTYDIDFQTMDSLIKSLIDFINSNPKNDLVLIKN